VVRVLAKTGPAGVRVALATLDRAAPQQRRGVVTAMWGMGPGAELAVPRLLELGRGSPWADEYVSALAYAGARAIPALVQALSRPEDAPLAVSALSHMNPRSTPVAALTEVLNAGGDAAAASAARALGEIGPDAGPSVGRLVERFSTHGGACETRKEIAGALAAIGDVEGLSVIERGLGDACREVQVASIRALGAAGPSARGP
jgi:HEAT repeat protein